MKNTQIKRKIVIATNNAGKIAELREMLAGVPVDLLGLGDFPDIREVEETGDTFLENARLKATGYALQTGLPALADDSGLSVDALNGRPGVLSARYGGEDTAFAGKMQMLLVELENVPDASRTARFSCALAFAGESGGMLFETEASCEGHIAEMPSGSGGFGYDPIFVPNGFDETFGQIESGVKQQISHRAAAFREILPFLRHFATQ